MSTPLLLEVAPEIDTNPTSFYGGGVGGSLRFQTPVIGSRSALAMSVHSTYFDLATPLKARDDEVLGWQWHQLDHMQTICTSLETDNHTCYSTPHHSICTGRMLFLTPNQECQSSEGSDDDV